MIEIKVKLLRGNSDVFATGEIVECMIEFRHLRGETDPHNEDEGCNDRNLDESLAWASAQLHCYRRTSYKIPAKDKMTELADLVAKTSLDGATPIQGDVIFASTPKILFCDLMLKPGEEKSYLYSEELPREGPPTYRGTDIRYFYKLTIATQRIKSKVQTLTVPLRVLPIPIIERPEEALGTEETNAELKPTNPFLEQREITELEASWTHVKNITARRAPKYYRISNKRGFVGRFCIFKSCYKIGEDIVATLDFTGCEVKCVQFLVKLQLQEISLYDAAHPPGESDNDMNDTSSVYSLDRASVASGSITDKIHKMPQMSSSLTSSGISAKSKEKHDVEPTGKVSTFATKHQLCYAYQNTHFILTIPQHVPPSFSTNLVNVKWRLHFEFVTSTMMNLGSLPDSGEIQAPAEVPIETMAWDLPITIYAANPLKLFSTNQQHSLFIK